MAFYQYLNKTDKQGYLTKLIREIQSSMKGCASGCGDSMESVRNDVVKDILPGINNILLYCGDRCLSGPHGGEGSLIKRDTEIGLSICCDQFLLMISGLARYSRVGVEYLGASKLIRASAVKLYVSFAEVDQVNKDIFASCGTNRSICVAAETNVNASVAVRKAIESIMSTIRANE